MPAPAAVTWDKLGKLNGTPRCPVLLDVLADRVRACDPRLFRGARPQAEAEALPAALGALAAALPGPAMPCRRAEGVAAEYLEGGQAAWTAAGLPLVDPRPHATGWTGASGSPVRGRRSTASPAAG